MFGVLYACILYFCICTCSAQLSMFHMERRSRNTLIIIIIIIMYLMLLGCSKAFQMIDTHIHTATHKHIHTLRAPPPPPPPLQQTYIILVGAAIADDVLDDEAVGLRGWIPGDQDFPCAVAYHPGAHRGRIDVIRLLCCNITQSVSLKTLL